ncbi:hypothetical protein AQJ58_20245 [Streptomyces sp. DSM 15324]|nr:hypothetical protein AQJ58_20245 [Streptomyces sp. DSM 15324]
MTASAFCASNTQRQKSSTSRLFASGSLSAAAPMVTARDGVPATGGRGGAILLRDGQRSAIRPSWTRYVVNA